MGRKRDLAPDLGDPLDGLANLFDLGLVFVVGLVLALFSVYHLQGLFDKESEMTIMKKSLDGTIEMVVKDGKKIRSLRMSRDTAAGRGVRLGTAYRLEDGTFVYVPE